MRYLFFVLILILSFSAFGQKIYHQKAQNLFLLADSCLADGNGIYYVKLTNADTVTSVEIQMHENRNGNMRVTSYVDSISGASPVKVYIDLGIKVGVFGSDAINYIWTNIDSLVSEGDRNTIEISDLGYVDDPILAYKLRIRGVLTSVNRVYVQVLNWKPE